MIIQIRPLSTQEEICGVEQLQRDVWDLPNIEVVPLHVLLTAAKNGGLLLGAFDGATLAGFVFGFPGLTRDGKLKHCSHMAGVHPAYRDRGVGYSLKLAQRLHVLAQGIDLITWTFDPLETRNATLNFHKLGAVCNTYLPNLYGDMRDGLNAGLPSDRFQVDWWIASERVSQQLERAPSASPSASAFVVRIRCDISTASRPAELTTHQALIAIPTNFQSLKAANIEQARALRLRSRSLFESAFASGYCVTDFFVDGEQGYYLIES